MATPSFDPARALQFDLARGSVRTQANERLALVPVDALVELARTGPATVVESVGHIIGRGMGKRILGRLGDVGAASVESFVSHLGGELALAGHGVVSLERWGRAMVVVVTETMLDDALLAAVLEGALGSVTGRQVSCTPLMNERDGDAATVRMLVSSRSTATRVRSWLRDRVAWGEALARLQVKDGVRA